MHNKYEYNTILNSRDYSKEDLSNEHVLARLAARREIRQGKTNIEDYWHGAINQQNNPTPGATVSHCHRKSSKRGKVSNKKCKIQSLEMKNTVSFNEIDNSSEATPNEDMFIKSYLRSKHKVKEESMSLEEESMPLEGECDKLKSKDKLRWFGTILICLR